MNNINPYIGCTGIFQSTQVLPFERKTNIRAQSELSMKIASLMKEKVVSKYALKGFLRENRSALAVFAIKNFEKWLLFSQCMQEHLKVNAKIYNLLERLNFIAIVKEENDKSDRKTFAQWFPRELRELIALNIQASYHESNSELLRKIRLLLLEDAQVIDFPSKIKGIPVSFLVAWINVQQVRLYALDLNIEELDQLLPELEYTYLAGSTDITLVNSKLKKVTHLCYEKVTNDDLKFLSNYNSLETLNLSRTKIADAGLEHLKDIVSLISLDLTFANITDAGLMNLTRLTNLTSINLCCCKIRDGGLSPLKLLTKLISVDLWGCAEIKDAGIRNLKKLTALTCLDLRGTKISNFAFKHLKGLINLKNLILTATKITDEGLDQLKDLINLTFLNLWVCKITDAGLDPLKSLLQLTSLNLSSTKITDAGLQTLATFTSLKSLDLSHCKNIGARLEPLTDLTNLTSLSLRCCSITSAGLQALKTITSLKNLDLVACSTDRKIT